MISSLESLPENSVHLIVTSPPFNVGIGYDKYTDNLPHLEYLAWMKKVWAACKRVLVPGGRICINIDATTNLEEGENALIERVHPLHVDFTNQLRELGYIYRAEIVWTKQNAPGKDTAWGSYTSCSNPHIRRNTEYIVIASKDNLKLDGDTMQCDLTKDEFHKWTLSEWQMKPETNDKGHPVPYPRELVVRCIKLFSYVGNTVLDPFNGSGTTTTTAIQLGRNYIGIDQSERYCRKARQDAAEAEQEIQIAGGYHFEPSPTLVKQGTIRKRHQKQMLQRDVFEDSQPTPEEV